jgi:hypothetical protein
MSGEALAIETIGLSKRYGSTWCRRCHNHNVLAVQRLLLVSPRSGIE